MSSYLRFEVKGIKQLKFKYDKKAFVFFYRIMQLLWFVSLVMGNTFSREREGVELFRYENKKIAKRLGFKNNLE